MGYQFVLDKKITFEIYTGAGYKKNQIIEVSPTNRKALGNQIGENSFIYDSNLRINFGFNFGIIFFMKDFSI